MKKSLIILFNLILFFSLVTFTQAQETYEFVTEWNTTDIWQHAVGIAVDKDGFVYVAGGQKIVKYTSDGAFVLKIENIPNDDRYYFSSWEMRLAVDKSGNIYVSSWDDNMLVKFDSGGNYLAKWGGWNDEGTDYYFNRPAGIAVDDDGNIYICDSDSSWIIKLDPSGNHVTQWHSWNDAGTNHNFNRPRGIILDNSGNVYVLDKDNHRIVKFDSSGNYMDLMFGSYGSGDGQFQDVKGIAVDFENNVYVVDEYLHRVCKFDSGGNFIQTTRPDDGQWGGWGNDDYHFNRPRDIAVDYSGNIFIADSDNYRIMEYRLKGAPAIEITNPVQNEAVAGSVNIQATVTVPDTYTISNVEFFRDDTSLNIDNEASYEFSWVTEAETNGPYTLWVVATNNESAKTREKVSVIVANGDDAPEVTITYPADQDEVRGDVSIEATATDIEGITKVEFYVDGIKVGENDTGPSPYTYSWNTTTVEDGEREIKVIAYDTITRQVEDSINITVRNYEEYAFVTSWYRDNPTGIAVDKYGKVYVASCDGRIRKYEPDGTLIFYIESNTSDYSLSCNMRLAVDDLGYIYASCSEHHVIVKFKPNGNYLTKWGSHGNGNTQFNTPRGIAVSTDGYVYICDEGNQRIVKYTTDGTYVAQWGTQGNGNGQFQCPRGIALGISNNIYIVDHCSCRVQVFEPDGSFLRKWGNRGEGNNQFWDPDDMAIDNEGNVYIADRNNHRIVKYTSEGAFITKWGSQGSGDLQFSLPWGIALDDNGNVYVVDQGWNNRIARFKSTWKPTCEITTPTDYEVVDGIVPINVNATSDIGIDKVEFYIDDSLVDTVTGTLYIYNWFTELVVDDGTYTIKAIAYNADGKTAEAEISVVVNNLDNETPTVLITSPENESTVRLTAKIEAEASGVGDDISKVEFYVNGTKIGEDTIGPSPYEYTWDATTVDDGDKEIKAIAYDSIGQRAEDSITVTVINHEEFAYLDKWSTRPPCDIELDKDENLYVTGEHKISKYSPDGTLISTIEDNSDYYNLSWWLRVAVDDSGNIYVSNSDRNQIIKFDSDGNYVTKWGSYGSGNDQLDNPAGIAVDSGGNVYVCDNNNHRIVKYKSDGTEPEIWGETRGSAEGQFAHPNGIAVDDSNNVYVADSANNRVQVFSSGGTFITKWGNQGSGDGQFNCLSGIALDSEGNVYVVDNCNYRVQKFSSTGTFITKWGTRGSDNLQFECPSGIAVDSHFNVYVSDTCNNRITKFKSTWKPTVEITYPTDNSTITDAEPHVTIEANADSAVGISRVEFYIDGTKKDDDITGPSPYTYVWDTSSLENKTYTIKAKAYNIEGRTVEDEISVVVNRTGDKAPFVSITNPQNEDIIRLTTTIEAEASDEDLDGGITKVEFYVDGTKVGEDTGNPYFYTWDATTVEEGEKEIKVIAYDTIGQRSEQSITVTVINHEEFAFVDMWSRNNPIDVEVDKDGNIFVSGNNRISKYSPDGTLISEIEDNSSDYDFSWYMCIAIDDFGNIYVTNEDRSTVIKFDSNGNYVKKWGSYGYGDYKLNSPRDIAVDSQGNVYVVDHGNNRIVKYDSEGTFQTEWGNQGGSDGQFEWPWGIAVDDSGNIYVADQHNHRIQVFNSNGEFLRKWGHHGYADNEFRCPLGIAFDSEGNVYIVNNCNYNIVKYTSAGTFLAVWGTRGSGDLGLECPTGIAVDSNFNVYVADHCNGRVTIFRSIWLPSVEITNPFDNLAVNGTVPIQANAQSAVGISKVEFYINDTNEHEDTTGPSPYTYDWNTLPLPDGTYTIKAKAYNAEDKTVEDEISVVVNNTEDSTPHVSLTNPANEAVVRLQATIEAEASDLDVDGGIAKVEFYADGTLVTTSIVSPYVNSYSYKYTWDATGVEDGEREIKVIAYDSIGQMAEASVTVTVVNHEEFGYVDKWSRDNAVGLAVDKDGNLYAAGNNRISKYSPDGTLILEIEDNSSDYNFSWWMYVTVDDSGNIYVSNSDRHQIVKFDSNGNYVTKWGSYGYGDYRLNNPDGIATDSEGNVYVCDYHNNRIVKYDPEGTYLTELGSQGGGDGQFNNPQGIAIDDEDYIYVVDRHNNRIQVFKPDGEFLRKWGKHGYGDDQLRCPEAVALDSEGNVYVVDPCNYKVVKFTSGGTFVATWGTQGSGDLEFECPNGIAVDSLFNVYVADRCNGRIMIFKSTWRPVVEITNPTDYEPVSGTVTIQADVETAIGISKVEFSIDETLMATVTEKSPGTENTYEYNWETVSLSVTDGTYTVKAKAYSLEGKTAQDEISVVVNNIEDKAPTVSITNLNDGDIIRLEATIEAEASDEDPGWITKVEFYIDGVKVGEDTTNAYEYTWDAAAVEDGEKEIKVIAYDSIGQRAEAVITVTVVNHEEFAYLDKWSIDNPCDVELDKDENLYVSGGHSISKYAPDGILISRIEDNSSDYNLSWHMYVAVDDSGNIYVSNSDRHEIIKFDPDGNYVTKWGDYGSDDNQFDWPMGIAVDNEGYVYVCDNNNHRIVKYTSNGTDPTIWGEIRGSDDGQFQHPQGIAVDDSNNVYVTDGNNHRIQVFSSDGTFIRKWGSYGSGDNQLHWPTGIAFDSEGNVYIVDNSNHRVVKNSSDGTFLTKWGTRGNGDLQLENPEGVAVDSLFNVYVADRYNNRIVKFKSTWKPTIEITNPLDNSVVNDVVQIQADTESAVGISKVEFSIDETLMATVTEIKPGTEKTYEYNWETITLEVEVPDGPYTLKAKAYNIEGKAVEDEISVIVNNSGNKAPEISITSPADGEVIRKTVDIKADATDTDEDGGIAMVEYYIENTLVYTVTAASSIYSWDTTTVGDGETEIKVIAYDQIGQNTSASIMVTVANQEAYEYVSKFDTWDYGHPRGIAIGKYGHIYATFCERIVKFTSNGGFLFRIDNEGSNNNYQLTCDMRIAVDYSGNIYVSCREIHTIIKFDPYGKYVAKWGSQGSGDDQFNGPEGLDVDSQGNVYVCDSENHRIVKFDSDGGYIAKFGSRGHGDGQFQYPWDIALDDENNMYIAENWNNRVQVLNSEGTFIRKWGNHGYGDGQFRCVAGIALDSDGNVYTADGCNNRVQKFSSDGTFITKWGSWGSGDTNFDWPHDLAVDDDGNIYVADHGNRRIVVFRIIGTPTVEITDPLDNQSVGDVVTISVNAESEFGIDRVEFYIDGNYDGEDTTGPSPYTHAWDTNSYSNGSHEIKAVAYNTDLKSRETSISVVVSNEGDLAPTVSITNIKDEAVIRGTVIVKADAEDDLAIDKVEFYVDENLLATFTEPPYEYTWDTTTVADGRRELKVVAYDTLGQSTWATVTVFVDNSYSVFSADLSGAAVIFINTENKLMKIDFEGNPSSQVISTDPDVAQFQFGPEPERNLYIFFWGHQELRDRNSYILVKINPETNEVTGIDKTLSHMEWNEHTASPNIQFDGQGNTYYLARDENWNLVLRKYTSEGNIEDLINENINIWHWHVRDDGTVVMGGETETTRTRWIRRLNPNDPDNILANIAEPSEIGWIAEFPDNRIYAGMRFSEWHHAIYRLPEGLTPMTDEERRSPYIGPSGEDYQPEYDAWQLTEGHTWDYYQGFINWHGGSMLYCEEDVFTNVYGLMAGWWEVYRTVLRLYPVPEIIEPQTELLDRPTLMRVWQDKIVIAGSKDGVNKLVLYDISTGEETNLLDQNIEIYHLDVLSNGNIILVGLRFEDNKIVVGMPIQTADASEGMVKSLGFGFKELAELGGRPLSFGVFKEVSGSTVVAVSIAYLSSGTSVSGVVKIQAAASSPEGVDKVEFYIDGELKATDLTFPYTYNWDTTAYSEGSHTIKVKMIDKASQTAVHEIPVIVNNTTSPGEIVLSTNQIFFAASTETSPTTDQKLVIENTGGMPLNWTATPSESWIQVSPLSGTGSGIITVSANPAGLSVGTHTGNIMIKDPNAINSPLFIIVTLKIYSAVSVQKPFGAFETPQDGTSGIVGALPVTGWALDDIEVAKVEIWREPVGGEPTAANGLVYIGDAGFVEGARPDVAEMYPNYPLCYQAGWGYLLLTNYLPSDGNGTYTLYAVAYDKEGNKADLGSKTISCDNSSASEPFGTIDTPTEGGDASGGTFINFGWALTPQPNSIATDGSAITVYVNGEDLGHPTYNQYRSDVADLFPGYANSDGAVGYFYLDTTEYRNGVHVIAWNVEDDGGNSADIGTRYFTIVNVDVMGSFSAGMGGYRVDPGTAPAFRYVDNIPTSFKSVRVRSGNRRNVEPVITEVDNYGVTNIAIREVERVQVELGEGADYEGYMIVGGALKPLPAGSTLNTEEGTFSWQPGAGFIGEYYLVFIKKDATGAKTKIKTRITILPKFSIY